MATRFGALVLVGRADVPRERVYLATSALLFLASAAGTICLCGSMSGDMSMPGGWTMSMAWMRMAGQSWLGAAASFMTMWVVMMVAMMLPSLVPMLSSYRRFLRAEDAFRGGLTALAGAGYFFVWTVVGAVAYPVGVGLAAAEMKSAHLSREVPLATGLVILVSGCIQLTGWKARHLERCRNALACGRLRAAGALGAWRHGLRLGVHCALCCSGFMMILLVAGAMDLAIMVLIAAAITAERLAPHPKRVARVAGLFVVAAAAVVIVRALTGRSAAALLSP